MDAEVGTEFLHAVFHFDAGIHAVGFFGQFVEFELQHFVFADGADVISSLRIYIQGVGIGVVGVGYFVVALCFGQVEELLCGIGGNKLKGFYVGFLGFAITDRFDAPIPLQAVVAKQGLAVSDVDG